MDISVSLQCNASLCQAELQTGPRRQALTFTSTGQGCAVNGGELLLLALATCYCNDLYREAQQRGIRIDAISVSASARFPGVGLAATDIRYHARIDSSATPAQLQRLLEHTDSVAEVHNTVRSGCMVQRTP